MNTLNFRTTPVLGVDVASTNMRSALRLLQDAYEKRIRGYVCFVSVHGLMESRSRPELATCFQEALCCLPDGAPVAWVGRSNGEMEMGRVGGPDFMLELFANAAFRDAKHFFLGGAPGVADELGRKMQERFPGTRVVGTYTPPFHAMDDRELATIAAIISNCKPDFLWVGLGCPKQEMFMQHTASTWDAGITLGVGAAFDFHTGRLHDSPVWVKKAGLQWLHRLIQEPGRLWRRYLFSNCAFLWALLMQKLTANGPSARKSKPGGTAASGELAPHPVTAVSKRSA